jgi:hypothetical protein
MLTVGWTHDERGWLGAPVSKWRGVRVAKALQNALKTKKPPCEAAFIVL